MTLKMVGHEKGAFQALFDENFYARMGFNLPLLRDLNRGF